MVEMSRQEALADERLKRGQSRMLGHDRYCHEGALNHSCDGNCWLDEKKVVTNREVAAGEELTIHYGLFETEASLHRGMRCLCGSGATRCQGTLRLDDYRDIGFVTRNRDHMSPFVARKARELGWHHAHVHLAHALTAASAEEMGLFAFAPIPAGATVLYFGGKVVGRDELLHRHTRHFVQVAAGLWMVPTDDGPETPDYVNHSCDPSCGMLDSATVVARRDIGPGEEITIDYATVMDETLEETGLESFECKCGAVGCRRRVTPSDHRIAELRERYRGLFPPFMRLV